MKTYMYMKLRLLTYSLNDNFKLNQMMYKTNYIHK